MKVFIFGQSGMLGRYVHSFLLSKGFVVAGINRDELDITKTNERDLRTFLSWADLDMDDVIINCAGLIKQRTDTSKFDFIQVNAIFPHLLQNICRDYICDFIHVTTDCVFTGLKGSYSELDGHDATDVYGVTKSLGEPIDATVIRTSIIGEELRNFSSLLEWVKLNKEKEVLGYTNHIWNGITCLQFAKVCKHIIDNKLYWQGVRHITSPSNINKFDLVNLISDIYKLNIKVVPHETSDKCDRSLVSVMSDVVFEIPELKEQLIELKNFATMLGA